MIISIPYALLICLPGLLSFQQFPVGGDLNVEGQFDVHQLLVLAHLAGHVRLGFLDGLLEVPDAQLGILYCQATSLLSLCNLDLNTGTLHHNRGMQVN